MDNSKAYILANGRGCVPLARRFFRWPISTLRACGDIFVEVVDSDSGLGDDSMDSCILTCICKCIRLGKCQPCMHVFAYCLACVPPLPLLWHRSRFVPLQACPEPRDLSQKFVLQAHRAQTLGHGDAQKQCQHLVCYPPLTLNLHPLCIQLLSCSHLPILQSRPKSVIHGAVVNFLQPVKGTLDAFSLSLFVL